VAIQTEFVLRGNWYYGPPIDPEEEKDYMLDVADFLGDTDTISSVTWEATQTTGDSDNDITIVTAKCGATSTTATVWLTGAVLNVRYMITAHITTVEGRLYDLSFRLKCREL
jgi:hypothetical protein